MLPRRAKHHLFRTVRPAAAWRQHHQHRGRLQPPQFAGKHLRPLADDKLAQNCRKRFADRGLKNTRLQFGIFQRNKPRFNQIHWLTFGLDHPIYSLH